MSASAPIAKHSGLAFVHHVPTQDPQKRKRDIFYPPSPLSPVPHKRHKIEVAPQSPEEAKKKKPEAKKDTPEYLHELIKKNNFKEVAEHLTKRPQDINTADEDGNTALHFAASKGAVMMVQTLSRFQPNYYANDNEGYTAVYRAIEDDHYQTAMFINDQMIKDAKTTEGLWYSPVRVESMLKSFLKDNKEGSNEKIDAFVAKLVRAKPEDLNKPVNVIKYTTHLLRLDGEIFGIDAEGWWSHRVLEQRIRSLCYALIHHPTMPPKLAAHGQSSDDVRQILLRELVTELETLRLSRRIYRLSHSDDSDTVEQLAQLEAHNIAMKVWDQQPTEEYCLPLGFPGHALYTGLLTTTASDGHTQQPVVRVRIDNLGSGYRNAHAKDPDTDKVSSRIFNIPRSFLETASGAEAFEKFIADVIICKVTSEKNAENFYTAVARFQLLLKEHYPDALIDDRTGIPDDDRHAPQSVGNCSLENHTRGIRARLQTRELFKWFSHYEESLARTFFKQAMEEVLDKSEQEKFKQSLQNILETYEKGLAEKLTSFLSKPRREKIASKLKSDEIYRVIKRDDHASLTLLLGHGADPDLENDASETLLYRAVEKGSIGSAQALLKAGATVDRPNYQGQTPLYCAAKVGHHAIVKLLITAGADVHKPDVYGKTPVQILNERFESARAALESLPHNPAAPPKRAKRRRYKN
jgi:uncharacterized protein